MTPPTLQARKQQLVRDAILDAATDLFAARGFDETTVDEIAEAAGVSRRSFFRYFESKNDLMAQGMLDFAAGLTAEIDGCPPAMTPVEVFRETVVRVAERSAAHPRTRKVMAIMAKYPAARAAEMSRIADVQDAATRAFARRCARQGEDELTARLLAGLTVQLVGVALRGWYEQRGQGGRVAETVDRALTRLRQLLGAKAMAADRSAAIGIEVVAATRKRNQKS